MLILLPPSEGKAAAPRSGSPVDLARLTSADALTDARRDVLTALQALCSGPLPAAMKALELSPGLSDSVATNARVLDLPTRTAAATYTGVLYDALDLSSLTAADRRRAAGRLLIMSAAFGVVRTTDRIPAYRLPPAARLPGLGTLASHWREPLADAMPTLIGRRAVLDLRSGPYASFWRPDRLLAPRVAVARVVHEARPGDRASRTVVSHMNKATKGRVARSLLALPAQARTVDDLVDMLRATGWAIDVTTERESAPRLDIVVDEV